MSAKEENLPLLKWIQDDVPSSGTDQYFQKAFNIGPWTKSGFQIMLKGGELGASEPDTMLENIADYEALTIELFQFPSGLSEDSLNMDPLEVEGIKIQFDVRIAPSPVHPQEDNRFKEREWAKQFVKGPAAIFTSISYAKVSPDIVCQIIRDCYSIYNMKAFW